MADYTEQFKALLNSPLGEELLRALNVLHDSLIADAEKAGSQEKAYGLLKEASGVMLSVSHIKGKAVLPSNRGNREV
jgi:hypothetical protein